MPIIYLRKCIEKCSFFKHCDTVSESRFCKRVGQKRFLKCLEMGGYDTIVECKKCGHREYLMFANGLKNGWNKCCGETMPILVTIGNIEEAVKSIPIEREGKVKVANEYVGKCRSAD